MTADVDPGLALAAPPAPHPFPLLQNDLRESRFTIKGGLYSADDDDAEELDDGWIASLSWMRFFSDWFALEFEAGYLDVDGEDSGISADVWAIPVMLNGRFNIPLWVFDVYAGAGGGTFYYDVEVGGGGFSADDDGFLLAGNAFVGATFNVAEAVAVGLEGKYYLTEEIEDADAALDAFALSLTLGFSN